MVKQSQSKIAWLENDQRTGIENYHFGSSFQPIFTLLRCFGVDVQWGEQRSQSRQLLAHFILVFWSSANSIINIIYVAQTIDPILRNAPFNEKIDDVINATYVSLQSVGVYFACLLAAGQHGRRLTKAFEQLETHFPNDQKLHDRMRRVSFIAVAFILITVGKKFDQFRF